MNYRVKIATAIEVSLENNDAYSYLIIIGLLRFHLCARWLSVFISMNAFTNKLERTYVSEYADPLETFSNDKFLGEFRMTKEEVRMLCDILSEDLNSRGSRKCDLNVGQPRCWLLVQRRRSDIVQYGVALAMKNRKEIDTTTFL